MSNLDGLINIGVIQYNQGGLSTELQRHALQSMLGGERLDAFADGRTARECDFIDVRVQDNGFSTGGSVPVQDIDNTGRESRLFDEFAYCQGREWCFLGRLQYHDITSGDCWCEFPGHHGQGEVPRNDTAANSYGLFACKTEIVSLDGDDISLELVCPSGIVAVMLDAQSDIHFGPVLSFVSHWLAIVKGFEFSQEFGVALHQIRKFPQQITTAGGVHGTPFGSEGKCLFCRCHSTIDICGIRFLNFGNDFFGGRIDSFEFLAIDGIDKFVVDEQTSFEF
mmetsp:Transcript_8009/g.14167  ORF Transcript_8009/g.14167 Transcript_8009/m.14167 type:complete len:280 (-) Transcript_8009:106-945(-)